MKSNLFSLGLLAVVAVFAFLGGADAAFGQGAFTYQPLEKLPGASDARTFPQYIEGLYKFGIWTVGLAALFMISVGGFIYLSSGGNSSTMGTAKKYIWDALIGLSLALLAWLVLNIINPDLVNVNLSRFSQVGGSAAPAGTQHNVTTSGGGIACSDPDITKAALASGGKVCDGVVCDKRCAFDAEVSTAIEANSGGIDKKIIKALICRESSGNKNATNPVGGVMSCGLMQVNYNEVRGNTSCSGPVKNLFDPATNIREGARVLSGKLARVNPSPYALSGIDVYQMAFAAYNCCANGDNPNGLSVSCKNADGWRIIPKWACPLNPGSGIYTMCHVKDYACKVSACAKTY